LTGPKTDDQTGDVLDQSPRFRSILLLGSGTGHLVAGSFDNLGHEMIVTILNHSIHDNRFIKLVKEMLQAGYMDDWQYHRTYSGVPQGGVVSPILSNIVLNELDKYVEDQLIPRYTKGGKRARNREYDRLWAEKQKAKQQGDKARYRELTQQLRHMPRYDPHDPHYRRLRYQRYADDVRRRQAA
jgi:hypothetical protein